MPSDYQRIEHALHILDSQQGMLSLDELADKLDISAGHFQRMFSRWVGISPKRFSQLITVERAKQLLSAGQPLLNVSEDLSLSSSSRLYDHFIRIEAMTPGDYRSRGENLRIRWGNGDSPFGEVFIAQTQRGICALAFGDGREELMAMQQRWPAAQFSEEHKDSQELLRRAFNHSHGEPLSLHLLASDFQLQVWRALLAIRPGQLSTYGQLGQRIGQAKAARAVGRAVGSNPVALLIPCHRVVRQTGALGGYRWGVTRKRAILLHEAACNSITREDGSDDRRQ